MLLKLCFITHTDYFYPLLRARLENEMNTMHNEHESMRNQNELLTSKLKDMLSAAGIQPDQSTLNAFSNPSTSGLGGNTNLGGVVQPLGGYTQNNSTLNRGYNQVQSAQATMLPPVSNLPTQNGFSRSPDTTQQMMTMPIPAGLSPGGQSDLMGSPFMQNAPTGSGPDRLELMQTLDELRADLNIIRKELSDEVTKRKEAEAQNADCRTRIGDLERKLDFQKEQRQMYEEKSKELETEGCFNCSW